MFLIQRRLLLTGLGAFMVTLLLIGVLWLAWFNGANDNFKGVATLYGSQTVGYKSALAWATLGTIVGSVISVLLAQGLVKTFSGSGLMSAEYLNTTTLTAVGLSAAVTIMLATRLGMPTSTTHALTGALVGVALMTDAASLSWHTLTTKFAQPLLVSPLLAVAVTIVLYPVFRYVRRSMGGTSDSCVCLGTAPAMQLASQSVQNTGFDVQVPVLSIGNTVSCTDRYQGRLIGVEAQTAVNVLHFASAGAVCFARAVNDTPKIAALLMVASPLANHGGILLLLVALAMGLGGLIQSRNVAETMSHHITRLNTGQGLTANMVTSLLVLGASHLGVPVSTTHVSCGAIFGIGLVNGKRDWKTIRRIGLAWVTTLPLALAIGAGLYFLIAHLQG